MGDTTILVDDDGNAREVRREDVAQSIASGQFHRESDEEHVSRAAEEHKQDVNGGVSGAIRSGFSGLANTVTFGGMNAAIRASKGQAGADVERDLEGRNPVANIAGSVVGAVVDPLGTYGALGKLGKGLGFGERVVGRLTGNVAAGALEGAAQSAGSYVSDVALGDRKLSADGFVGAMGHGALWGGVGAGALSVGGEALASARRMFPAGEVTEQAVAKAEQEAAEEMSSAVKDGHDLEAAARSRTNQIAEERAATDPTFAQQRKAIKLQAEQEIANERVATVRAREEATRARIKSKAGDDFLDSAMPKGAKRRAFVSPETIDAIESPVAADAAAATESPASQLERQLQATKNALDGGTPLAKLSGSTRGTVDDALDAHLASVDSEAKGILDSVNNLKASRDELGAWLDKYGGGQVSKFERSQAARDYAEGMRPKQAGYYTKVPAGEGSVGLPRGRYSQFRGTPEEQNAADSRFFSGVMNSDRAQAIDRAGEFARIDEMIDGRSPISASARDIVNAEPVPGEAPSIDDHVKQALRAKGEDFGGDLNESADVIGKYEHANADLAEKLGDAAPPGSKMRGEGFRDAQKAAAEKTAQQTAQVGQDMATAQAKGPGLVRQVDQALRGKHPIIKTLDKIGQGAELLRMLGVPIPDPRNIPVVGPLLSMYLKARVASKIMRRMGGGVERTAETVIASKAAATRQEVYTAVDRMLEVTSRKMVAAAPFAGAPTAALAHTLFDDRQPGERKPYTSKPKADDLPGMYLARTEELNKASQPGAVERAVRARVQTSDPEILQEIIATFQRKLDFLNSKWPRPPEPPGMLAPDKPYVPPRLELAKVGRYIEAVENPAGVFTAAAAGQFVPPEHIEAVSTVYPPLYQDAQKRLVLKMSERKVSVPYKQRRQMSALFGIPLDSTATPEYGAFLQQTYKAPPPSPQPNQGVGGNVTLGQRVGTSFDSRGG